MLIHYLTIREVHFFGGEGIGCIAVSCIYIIDHSHVSLYLAIVFFHVNFGPFQSLSFIKTIPKTSRRCHLCPIQHGPSCGWLSVHEKRLSARLCTPGRDVVLLRCVDVLCSIWDASLSNTPQPPWITDEVLWLEQMVRGSRVTTPASKVEKEKRWQFLRCKLLWSDRGKVSHLKGHVFKVLLEQWAPGCLERVGLNQLPSPLDILLDPVHT